MEQRLPAPLDIWLPLHRAKVTDTRQMDLTNSKDSSLHFPSLQHFSVVRPTMSGLSRNMRAFQSHNLLAFAAVVLNVTELPMILPSSIQSYRAPQLLDR
jgi:hypothetical protein